MSYRQILVAVPARTEARTIVECIESIDAASRRVDAPVLVMIAADSCSDATVATARSVEVVGCGLEVRRIDPSEDVAGHTEVGEDHVLWDNLRGLGPPGVSGHCAECAQECSCA